MKNKKEGKKEGKYEIACEKVEKRNKEGNR